MLCGLAAITYIGLFGYCWFTAKKTVGMVDGEQHVLIEVREHWLMRNNEVWSPVFWLIENVAGYKYVGYVAAEENSAFLYEK